MCNPTDLLGGPKMADLSDKRTTQLYYQDGTTQIIEHILRSDQIDASVGQAWFGTTTFDLKQAPNSQMPEAIGPGGIRQEVVIADVKANVQIDRTQLHRGKEPPKPIDGAGEGTYERGAGGVWKIKVAAGRLSSR